MYKMVYVCPSCGATKTMVKNDQQTPESFRSNLPDMLVCGVRDCPDYAVQKRWYGG